MRTFYTLLIILLVTASSFAQKIYSGFSCSLPLTLNYVRTTADLIHSKGSYKVYQVRNKGQVNFGSGFQIGGYSTVNYRGANLSLGFNVVIIKRSYYTIYYPTNSLYDGKYRMGFGPDLSMNFPLLISFSFNNNGDIRPFIETGASYNWIFAGVEESETKNTELYDDYVVESFFYNSKSYFSGIIGAGIKVKKRYFLLQYACRLNGIPRGNIVSDVSLIYRVDLRGRKRGKNIYNGF